MSNHLSADLFALKEKYSDDVDMLNTISALITDTLNTDKEYLRVGGITCEATLIKEQFHKLKAQHIEYVLLNIQTSNKPIHNIHKISVNSFVSYVAFDR